MGLSGPHWLHATAAQGYIAGATERIRLGTSLTVLPFHEPIGLAKALSTLDWMSGGRMTVSFGVGWLKEEFDAMRVPFHERGRMADEYLAAMIALWTAEWATLEGRYVNVRRHRFRAETRAATDICRYGSAVTRRPRSGARPVRERLGAVHDPTRRLQARIEFIRSQPTYGGRGHRGHGQPRLTADRREPRGRRQPRGPPRERRPQIIERLAELASPRGDHHRGADPTGP